jgi:hypothetical protein
MTRSPRPCFATPGVAADGLGAAAHVAQAVALAFRRGMRRLETLAVVLRPKFPALRRKPWPAREPRWPRHVSAHVGQRLLDDQKNVVAHVRRQRLRRQFVRQSSRQRVGLPSKISFAKCVMYSTRLCSVSLPGRTAQTISSSARTVWSADCGKFAGVQFHLFGIVLVRLEQAAQQRNARQ